MELVMAGLSAQAFWAAMFVTLFAGFVKGAIGFALPMIMISVFSSFLPPEVALAGLMLPTTIANLGQAFRDGPRPVLAVIRKFWRFIVATLIFIAISAQFVREIPQDVFLVLLGIPITIYALLQLLGRSLAIKLEHQSRAEWGLGVIAGLYGGMSGVWGPPLIVYLMSIGTLKSEMMRTQGVIYLIGSIMLLAAHLKSGVLTGPNAGFSAALVIPTLIGMVIGYYVGDKLDQVRFRWWTQVLLVLTGLNLVRRAVGF
ncbi:sulfite exporter TauE/SafE family protein [Pseudorhodobacter sp.]|uniref:sulfite exporter TauE/SafE family protein n=1 Tax=Pseudorhodobacter sp. TaxID=1934400 RepID=UPI0026472DC2|nr:sulfite exporter TauE/SafE family protein [Pseudorhodobacter sp.]